MDAAARALLAALATGAILKAHRTLEGIKRHQLHALSGDTIEVTAATVRTLERRGLIASNLKFPAATYLLTAQGAQAAQQLTATTTTSLTIRK